MTVYIDGPITLASPLSEHREEIVADLEAHRLNVMVAQTRLNAAVKALASRQAGWISRYEEYAVQLAQPHLLQGMVEWTKLPTLIREEPFFSLELRYRSDGLNPYVHTFVVDFGALLAYEQQFNAPTAAPSTTPTPT